MSWSVPLFLYASVLNSDTALLPRPPSELDARLAADYILVEPEPLAYAHTIDPLHNPSYPLVTLRAFWSAERKDIQTSAWSLAELNTHGGDYEWIADIGYVSAGLNEGTSAHLYVPLLVSYDDSRGDAATSPLSYSDLNQLAPLESILSPVSFRAGHRVGFARHSTCSICHISMSEAYPSAGGADCAYQCSEGHSCFGSRYVLGGSSDPSMLAFDVNMRLAGDVLKEFGDVTVTTGDSLHMSMNYFCCYSAIDEVTINTVLRAFPWPQVNISFDKPIWRIDSDAASVDHYSIIVMADARSQEVMRRLVADVEDAVRAAGVDIHVPRSRQEPFHSTLGVVDGTVYPCEAVISAVNARFTPGSWTLHGPLVLEKPDW